MTKRAKKSKRKHRPKKPPAQTKKQRHRRCEACGEHDPRHPVRSVVLQIAGKKTHSWRLCRGCLAVKVVALTDNRHGWW